MGLRAIELFAGAGLGSLAIQCMLGMQTVCYVELLPYNQRVLRQRMQDGLLHTAPVYDDVCTFDGTAWLGACDLLVGGFPCQPFSTASHGQRVAPDLWPQMLRITREAQPRFVFAENVQRAPIARAADDLVRLGYHCRFACLSAADVGAPHNRLRWWLVADADSDRQSRCPVHVEVASAPGLSAMAWWREDVSRTLGVDDGGPHRMDRLRALGNGQVPLVAATAWHLLRGEF